jgi:hypothetical protein
MNLLDKLNGRFMAPKLTRTRIVLAVVVAIVADALQLPLQAMPLAPEIIDIVAMVLTVGLVGFHLLLLPTFLVEFLPLVDMLPTWTGCVIAVIALRKREQGGNQPVIEIDPAPSTKPVERSLPPIANPPPPPAHD